MSRSKRIGTAAETAVLRAAHMRGMPGERIALAGSADRGDLHLYDGRVVIEVKSRKIAATPHQIAAWMQELDKETRRVAACDVGALVVKPPTIGVARVDLWDAWMWPEEFCWLHTDLVPAAMRTPIKMYLGDYLDLVKRVMT